MTNRTGPASGPGAPSAVPGRQPPAPGHALRTLGPAECFGLLEPGGVGRVGFASANGIMILPVNFAVTGKAIIFRTAPDTLLALYANAQLSFEVDPPRRGAPSRAGASWCKVARTGSQMSVKSSAWRTERASSRGRAAPATCTCASRRPGSAGDASAQAGPARRRQTAKLRPAAPSRLRLSRTGQRRHDTPLTGVLAGCGVRTR
jgi:hypothetical protein